MELSGAAVSKTTRTDAPAEAPAETDELAVAEETDDAPADPGRLASDALDADAEPATPESAAVAEAEGPFDDLVAWITGLKLDANALKLSETEEDRWRHRRSLAFLLAERGLVHEAVTALTSALESGYSDRRTGFADSLYLAELLLETGNVEGAAGIAQELSAGEQTPQQRIRLARVLQRCDFPDLALANLEEVLPRLVGEPRVEAQMLLARAYWDRKEVDKARQYVRKLTESEHVPVALRGGAFILEADCAWAQGRTEESERLYRRALQETLDDEEASWVTLQLGNAARRTGRLADAIDHYRDARDRWPDTFFGAQADWFLRVTEQTERLANAEALRDRG
jgi:tetratricopeptide (TPR) repeat protein